MGPAIFDPPELVPFVSQSNRRRRRRNTASAIEVTRISPLRLSDEQHVLLPFVRLSMSQAGRKEGTLMTLTSSLSRPADRVRPSVRWIKAE